jgi:hypothetical protein
VKRRTRNQKRNGAHCMKQSTNGEHAASISRPTGIETAEIVHQILKSQQMGRVQ